MVNMKKIQISVIVTFVLIIGSFSLISLFANNDGFSAFENRELLPKPVLTTDSYLDGTYGKDYEAYLLDNFLLRNWMINGYQAYSSMFYLDAFSATEEVLMTVDIEDFVRSTQEVDTKSPNSTIDENEASPNSNTVEDTDPISNSTDNTTDNSVSNSVDNSIDNFVDGDISTNNTTDADEPHSDINEPQPPTQTPNNERVNDSLIIAGDRVMMPVGSSNHSGFGSLLAEISNRIDTVDLYAVIGPTSAAYYASENYRTGSYDQSKAELNISNTAHGVSVASVYNELQKHTDEYIYYKSDVHWSALGAYYAYKAFCDVAGISAANISEDFDQYSHEPFLGGLYSQIYQLPQGSRLKNNPDRLDYYIPKVDYEMRIYSDALKKETWKVNSVINTDFASLGAYKYSAFAWGDRALSKIDTKSPSNKKVLVIKDSFGSAFIPWLVPNYSQIYIIDPKGFNNSGKQAYDAKVLIQEENIDDVIFCLSIYGSGRQSIINDVRNLFLK
jgi:hypothetical protein